MFINFFEISVDVSQFYYGNMKCTLEWTAAPERWATIEFVACDFNNPSACPDHALVTTNTDYKLYCGGEGNREVHTYMQQLTVDIITDGSSQGRGCAGYMLANPSHRKHCTCSFILS